MKTAKSFNPFTNAVKTAILIAFMGLLSFCVQGQTTYTPSPTSYPSSACSSGNFIGTSCSFTFTGSLLELQGTTDTQLNLTMAKCGGGSFSSTSSYYIKWANTNDSVAIACSSNITQIYPSGTSYTFTDANPGFTSGTRYYMLTVTNGASHWYSNVVTVIANSINQAPTDTTTAATNITTNSATLNGSVNPNGYNTSYLFEYGLTTSYGSNTSATVIGSGTTTLSENANITGLLSNTLYHFRIMAMNSNGTSYGNDLTFTTSSAGQFDLELGSAIIATPNPFVQGQSKQVNYSVSNTGSSAFIGTIKLIFCDSVGIAIAVMQETWTDTINAGQTKNYIHTYPTTTNSRGSYKIRVEYSIDPNWLGFSGGTPAGAGSYTNPIDIDVILPSGMANIKLEEFQFNFYNRQLHIRSLKNEEYRLTVFEMTGKLIYFKKIMSTEFYETFSVFSKGLYVLQIESNNTVIRKKIVIE